MSSFLTTQWTVILQAGQSDPARKAAALETLCRSYWKPLYGYTRSAVGSHQDAEDLTQGFFQHLLSKDLPAGLGPENGRFRSWLLAVLKNYLASRHRYETRVKRGGKGLMTVTLEEVAHELFDAADPDAAFEKEWARSVLANALEHLREECGNSGHAKRFEILGGTLFDHEKGDGATLEQATELGISQNAAKIVLTRMRQRYRELLREEVSRLVGDAGDVDEEIAHLVRALRGR